MLYCFVIKWKRLLEVTLINWRHTVFTADKAGNDFALAAPTEQMFCWITNCPYSEQFCWEEVKNRMSTSYHWKTEALRAIYWSKIWFLRAQPPALNWPWIQAWLGCAPKHLMSLKSPDSQMPLQEHKKLGHVLVDLWSLRLYKVPMYKQLNTASSLYKQCGMNRISI